MSLLVLAHPDSPGQRAVKRLLCCCLSAILFDAGCVAGRVMCEL